MREHFGWVRILQLFIYIYMLRCVDVGRPGRCAVSVVAHDMDDMVDGANTKR